MKLNFIQNLSDEVVRENHELKAQLLQARQQLKDYEWEMLATIRDIAPQPILTLTPQETFTHFLTHIREQLTLLRETAAREQQLRTRWEQLQQQQIEHVNTISQLTLTLRTQQQQFDEQVRAGAERQGELEQEAAWQRECNARLAEEMTELKVEKLRLEEGKRRTIEDLRLAQNSQLVAFREQNEEEHMRVERELRRELEMRDRTIKDMSRSLAALTDLPAAQNPQLLADIFHSLQRYELLTAANADLQQENQQLREDAKELFNRIIKVETNVEELKAEEQNLRSQLERNTIAKLDLEKQLLLKMQEINKCERDKEALEQYYDQRWNGEYKKVKNKLENQYNAKFEELQKNGLEKIATLQAAIKELISEKEELEAMVRELRRLHEQERKARVAAEAAAAQLQAQISELTAASHERALMSAEELLTVRLRAQEEKQRLLDVIADHEATILREQQQMRLFKLQTQREMATVRQQHRRELTDKDIAFALEKETMDQKYFRDIGELQKQILRQIDLANSIRTTVQRQFDVKLQEERAIRLAAVAEKEEELRSLNQRWIDKHVELENLLLLTRRKMDEQVTGTKGEVAALLDNEYHLHQQREEHIQQIQCLQVQLKTLETELQDRRTALSQREAAMVALRKELAIARSEVDALLDSRKDWKAELLDLQRDFLKQFDALRKLSDHAHSRLRDRIRELEDISRIKTIARKEAEKLQNISSQRESFRSELQLREAENVILHKVKDYYQARLRESEGQLARQDFKTAHVILARRPKKSRPCNSELASHRALDHSAPAFEKRRYAITSTQKHYDLTHSKARLEQAARRTVTSTSQG